MQLASGNFLLPLVSSTLLLLLLIPGISFAQTTGKLAGRVGDAQTDEALVGANIAISGTTTGVVSGEDGSFVLLGIPAGVYDIHVSYVGYQTRIFDGVTINAGYTRDLDVELQRGIEFEDIVVEYERPLIQKDAIGVPKLVTAEEIVNLPVRGVQSVAATQAGVVNVPGRDELFVRGGRSRDVAVYVDGVRVDSDQDQIGFTGITSVIGLPQPAIQEQEMLIGNISARYGDVMSGVVNIVTKSGGPDYFGSLEAMSSLGLDDYGKSIISGSLGGPLWGDHLSFFLSGEYDHADDGRPRSVELLRVDEEELERLRQNPQSIRVRNADGTEEYVDLPGDIAPGTTIPVDGNDNVIVADDGTVTLSDGTVIQLSGPDAVPFLSPVFGFEVLDPGDFTPARARSGAGRRVGSATANVTFRPYSSGRFRIGGRYSNVRSEDLGPGINRWLFAPDTYLLTKDKKWQTFVSYTHNFSSSTLLQAQIDYSDRQSVGHDPRFSGSIEEVLFYGDLDHPTNAVNARYKGLGEVGDAPAFVRLNRDGFIIPTTLVVWPGGFNRGYVRQRHEQWRASVLSMTQIGLHQLEIGGEFEQRTRRRWDLSAFGAHLLAAWYDDSETCTIGDCGPEDVADTDGDGEVEHVGSYQDLPSQALGVTNYYGYDFRGLNEVSSQDFAGLVDRTNLDVEPWRPRYYGGYVQDKIEYKDLVLNLGLRVDVFDNNVLVYADPFATVPIVRAKVLSDRPRTVGPDFAVYFDGDDVVGYRDRDGNFYDDRGQETSRHEDVTDRGTPRLIEFGDDEALEVDEWRQVFEDFQPHVNVMPRVGVSFPITDQALVYGRYGVVSQRPGAFNFPSIRRLLSGFGALPNPNLKPETTVDYEIGYRQRIGTRAALTVSGFFKQLKNVEAFRQIELAFPNQYATVQNEDFGTVKGLELDFELRRLKNVAINANYTLSFAEGTGTHALGERHGGHAHEAPKTVFPLEFDRRHSFNGSVDIRFGKGQGPAFGSSHLLEHFGVNVLIQAATGFPYTQRRLQGDLRFDGPADGPRNGSRMPATGTVNLRADRRIPINGSVSLSVFLWITNLFDWQNVYQVHPATGQPDRNGFLETEVGRDWLGGQLRPETMEIIRNQIAINPDFYGVPRQVQMGLRMTF